MMYSCCMSSYAWKLTQSLYDVSCAWNYFCAFISALILDCFVYHVGFAPFCFLYVGLYLKTEVLKASE